MTTDPSAIRVPLGAVYIDNLRYDDPDDTPIVLNPVPQDGETNVHSTRSVDLTVASLTTTVLSATVQVYWRSTVLGVVGSEVLVYDQASGGFQAGYSGTATVVQSPGSAVDDELWLSITRATAFASEEIVRVRVLATAGASNTETIYTFTAEDTTQAVITELLWLSPTKCRAKFDEKMQDDGLAGSYIFHIDLDEAIQVVAPDKLQLSSTVPDSSWIGYYAQITGTAFVQNQGSRKILSMNTLERTVTLDTSELGELASDDGHDLDSTGKIARHRSIKAVVTPYRFEFRLAAEITGEPEDAIQCAFEPSIKSVRQPWSDELPPTDDPDYYVVLDLEQGISFGRKYTLRGVKLIDQDGNDTSSSGATYDFTSPVFGLSSTRMQLWNLLDEPTREQDLTAGGHLCKACRVIQDAIDQFAFWVQQLQVFWDPMSCPESLLDHLLYTLGQPFRFRISTEMQKRRLASLLRADYRRTGLREGIEELLALYLGTPFTVRPYLEESCWILGVSLLGFDTWLGPSSAWLQNAFEVLKKDPTRALTDDERQAVREISEWAAPADMHFSRLIETAPVIDAESPMDHAHVTDGVAVVKT